MELPQPKQLVPTKVSDSSTESNIKPSAIKSSSKAQTSAQKTKISSTLAQSTPSGSAFKTKVGGASGSAKLLEKKKAISAASEARKARLAEMRQKAKPTTAGVSSATKPPPSNSKYGVPSTLKKMASNSALGESNKPNSILAKMREKAAAGGKSSENASVPAPPKKPTAAPTASATAVQRVSQVTTSAPPLAKKPSPAKALKTIHDPANKPAAPEPKKPSPKKPVEKPLSPMQTYDMSDRDEESDSESDSDEEYDRQKPRKSVRIHHLLLYLYFYAGHTSNFFLPLPPGP